MHEHNRLKNGHQNWTVAYLSKFLHTGKTLHSWTTITNIHYGVMCGNNRQTYLLRIVKKNKKRIICQALVVTCDWAGVDEWMLSQSGCAGRADTMAAFNGGQWVRCKGVAIIIECKFSELALYYLSPPSFLVVMRLDRVECIPTIVVYTLGDLMRMPFIPWGPGDGQLQFHGCALAQETPGDRVETRDKV